MNGQLQYLILFLVAVFVAALSQVLLKIAAMRPHKSLAGEYLNPQVIGAYGLFFLATLADVIAYRRIPLSLGPILEATSYFYVTVFGAVFFRERITAKKLGALAVILLGIAVFALLG